MAQSLPSRPPSFSEILAAAARSNDDDDALPFRSAPHIRSLDFLPSDRRPFATPRHYPNVSASEGETETTQSLHERVKELLALRGDETRQELGALRRQFAKSYHPDRFAPDMRLAAQAWMQTANELFDCAIARAAADQRR
jgi:hypothetical protein